MLVACEALQGSALNTGSGLDVNVSCPQQDCGQNGIWAGEGNKFRFLHLPPSASAVGAANDQGIQITSFKTQKGDSLRMEVVGDQLQGYLLDNSRVSDLTNSQITLQGPSLQGSSSHCATGDCAKQTYTLTLLAIGPSSFWTTCAPSSDCSTAPQTTTVYTFVVSTPDGGCAALCNPDVQISDPDQLAGTAVIFTGDVYDIKPAAPGAPGSGGIAVRSPDGSGSDALAGGEADIFNIACYGTSVSKLHFLRHTAASMGPAPHTTVAQRKTMLQVLAADYCGDGHFFTNNGLALGIDFDNALWNVVPQAGIGSAQSVDAMWPGGGSGASCIGTPRSGGQIQNVCVRPSCPAMNQSGIHNWRQSGTGDYIISTNAFPSPGN